jgi:hypothetical protein
LRAVEAFSDHAVSHFIVGVNHEIPSETFWVWEIKGIGIFA